MRQQNIKNIITCGFDHIWFGRYFFFCLQAYSNLCGLFALDKSCLEQTDLLFDAIQRSKAEAEPAYD